MPASLHAVLEVEQLPTAAAGPGQNPLLVSLPHLRPTEHVAAYSRAAQAGKEARDDAHAASSISLTWRATSLAISDA